jgi:hypothetical protein
MSEPARKSGVNFVDRRRLDDTGDLRDASAPEPPEPPAPPPPEPAAVAAPEGAAADGPQTVKFEQLLQSLVAPVQMVLSGQAGAVSREEALGHLNFTIEAVELLERKTRGNLTPAEAQALKSVSGSLKMIFMQMMNPAGKP